LQEWGGISSPLAAPIPQQTGKLENAKALHDTDVLAPVTGRTRSVRSRSKYKSEARNFGERSEVPVSREEKNPSVDAALGNQGVAVPCGASPAPSLAILPPVANCQIRSR